MESNIDARRAEVEATLFQQTKVEEPAKPKQRAAVVSAPPRPQADPPLTEVQKEIVSQKKDAPAPEPANEIIREPVAPRALGRGGEQHQAIQERLQSEAHALGFLAEVEDQLAKQSNRAADLMLKRGPISIAVEISVTTTTDHEFGNVKKCLAAGFTRVAVVSPKPETLKAIEAAVQAGLGREVAAQVSYHTPDELIAELRKLPTEAAEEARPSLPKERVTRGFKVRRHGPELSQAERKSKEDIAVKVMTQAMKTQ